MDLFELKVVLLLLFAGWDVKVGHQWVKDKIWDRVWKIIVF